MRTEKLGILTIGQAPRSDIAKILDLYLPASVTCVHAGVLDGLAPGEIAAKFSRRTGDATLVSRLLTDEVVLLGRAAVATALQQKIDMLEGQGCDKILLLCTGRFDDLRCKSAWLIEPDRIISPAVAALAGELQVGIIVPLTSQIESGREKWAALSRPPICDAASPYGDSGNKDALARAARNLRHSGAELLVLDCMGFGELHRRAARDAAGLPVIVSSSLIARLVAELF